MATKTFKKWQVISGSHYQNSKSYKKGAKFITDANMASFNTLPHAPKYKLIGDATEEEILQFQAASGFTGESAPVHVEDPTEGTTEEEDTEPSDSLEAMTIAELKALAKDESIDLTGIHSKADIVAYIREARAE